MSTVFLYNLLTDWNWDLRNDNFSLFVMIVACKLPIKYTSWLIASKDAHLVWYLSQIEVLTICIHDIGITHEPYSLALLCNGFIFYQDRLVIFQKRSITKRFYNWLLNFCQKISYRTTQKYEELLHTFVNHLLKLKFLTDKTKFCLYRLIFSL